MDTWKRARRLRYRGGRPVEATVPAAEESRTLAAPIDEASARTGNALSNLLDFSSNDYLGLRSDRRVVHAKDGLGVVGSGASPVLSGYTVHHRMLEETLSTWCGAEAAIVFSSGYACNLGVIACLAREGDLILSDQLNHASMIDGCRLSRARVEVYPHGNVAHVDDFLHRNRHLYQRALILTESVFSMDGDLAPLVDLADVARRHDAALLVDEAHAVGIYGSQGAGLVEEVLPNADQVLLKTGTLSKAIGTVGGYAVGSKTAIEYLVNFCRSYIFSTAPPPCITAAAAQSIQCIRQMHRERTQLRQQSFAFRKRLRESGIDVPSGDSPIVPVVVGSEERVLQAAELMRQRGLVVPAIRPPTVPAGTSRLRISLSCRHRSEDLDRLHAALLDAWQQLGMSRSDLVR